MKQSPVMQEQLDFFGTDDESTTLDSATAQPEQSIGAEKDAGPKK
jgi:hypothetical protein